MKILSKFLSITALAASVCVTSVSIASIANAQATGGGQAGGGQAGGGQAGGGQAGGIRTKPSQPGQAPADLPGDNPTVDPRALMYWNGYNQNPWFINPAVAQQLRLNPELMQSLRNNYQQNWNRYQTSLNGLPNTLTPEQRLQQQQQLTQQFENDFTGSLDQTIPDQLMRRRFQQMMTQFQGLNAFDNPNIIKRLDLSIEQRRQINRMQQEWRRTMLQLSRANGNLQDFDWKDFSRRSNLSIDEILSAEQQAIWREIRGEAFDLPPDIYVRGGAAAGVDGRNANGNANADARGDQPNNQPNQNRP